MFQSVDCYTSLNPASTTIGVIVQAIAILINSVISIGIVFLYLCPSPSPRQIGEVVLLLGMLVNVDCVKHLEN